MQSMSLVLRKAVLPKNVSLLKYFKGRPLATAANKKNIGVLSTVVPLRNLDKAKPLPEGTKNETTKPPPPNQGCGRSEAPQLRICVSSPHIVPISRTRSSNLSGYTRPIHNPMLLAHRTGSTPCLVPCSLFHTTYGHFKCKPPCPCPCPCPCPPPCGKCPFPCGPCGCPKGCNCLPPPCNTPPKCIQYMTGYYYYPYGVWFCGPYHVSGTCVPGGPCSPCGCGPCPGPPCPCPGPCPPPCGPCCPCPKCCACLSPISPISPVAVSGDPEPRCKSVGSQEYTGSITTPIAFCEQDRKRDSPSHSPTRTKSGISKFFPFNAIPSFPAKRLPHTTVPVCPYSTQPAPQPSSTSPEHTVYCVHSIETDFGSSLLPSNHPRSSHVPRAEKSSSYYTYSSDQANHDDSTTPPIRLSQSYSHRRRKHQQDMCPVLESPRCLVSKEERDRPVIFPGTFQYTNIPHYKRPFYPSTPGH